MSACVGVCMRAAIGLPSCIVGDGSVIQGWQQRGSWNERETKRSETRNETKRNAKRNTKLNETKRNVGFLLVASCLLVVSSKARSP